MEVSYDHESIRYTGRWGKTEHGMTATACGAYLEFGFEGDMAVARFYTLDNEYPRLHLWIQIDNGDMIEAPIDSFLRIRAKTAGKHVCRIINKGGTEQARRWMLPLTGKVTFIGVQTEKPMALPTDNRKTVEFVGDSITEGVLIDTDFANGGLLRNYQDMLDRCFLDDACATYAWLTAEALNLRPYIMGYGAVGVTKGGCGGVPDAISAYPYNFEGSPVTYGHPDYIIINHGCNDSGKPVEEFLAKYEEFLTLVRKIHPSSKIISLSMFFGKYHEEQGKLIEEFNKKNHDEVLYIDSCGWVSKEPIHPLRDGHKTITKNLVSALKAAGIF